MAMKIAAVSALVAFAVSILAAVQSQNSFETAISRALLAMAGTFLVGLIVGLMAQRMLEEQPTSEKLENFQAESSEQDR